MQRLSLPDEEIRENGRLFRAMSLEDRKLLFPERIAALSQDSPPMSVREYGKLLPTAEEMQSFLDDPQTTEDAAERIRCRLTQIQSLQNAKENIAAAKQDNRSSNKISCLFHEIHCDDEDDAGKSEIYCFGTVCNPDTEYVKTFRTRIYEHVGNGDSVYPDIRLLESNNPNAISGTMLPIALILMEADRAWENFLAFLQLLDDFLSRQENVLANVIFELAQEGLPQWLGVALAVADMLLTAYELGGGGYFDPNKDDLVAKGAFSYKIDSSLSTHQLVNRTGSRRRFDYLLKTPPNYFDNYSGNKYFYYEPQIGSGSEGWYSIGLRLKKGS